MVVTWVMTVSSRNLDGTLGYGSIASPLTSSADFLDARFPLLSNSLGLNFLNPSDLYSVGPKNVSDASNGASEYAGYEAGVANNYFGQGIPGRAITSIADEDIRPVDDAEEVLEKAAPESEEATEAIEAVSAGESIAEGSNPVGLALIVNQQLGQAVNSTMTQGTEQQITSDMVHNSQQNGLNVGLNSQLIRSTQEQTRSNQDLGGTIGSLFGPLGALIGHAIAGTVQPSPNLLNTANSFGGALNPSDTNVVDSASTASLSGQSNLVDNVD